MAPTQPTTIKRNRQNNLPAELRFAGDGKPSLIEGYAAVYYRSGDRSTEYPMGSMIERVLPGAFDASLRSGHDVIATFQHKEDVLLGSLSNGSLRLRSDNVGLRYEVDIDHDDPDHARVWPKIRSGLITGSSFSFLPRKYRDRREAGKRIRTLSDVLLIEVGPVYGPAYKGTSAAVRSADHSWIERRLRMLEIDDRRLERE